MIMEQLFCFVLVVALAHADLFDSRMAYDIDSRNLPLPDIGCTRESEDARNVIIEKSKCGQPKWVLEYLDINTAHQIVSPRAVWTKRCVGLCQYENSGVCRVVTSNPLLIPIRLYDLKTDKESCATFPLDEDATCRCDLSDWKRRSLISTS